MRTLERIDSLDRSYRRRDREIRAMQRKIRRARRKHRRRIRPADDAFYFFAFSVILLGALACVWVWSGGAV